MILQITGTMFAICRYRVSRFIGVTQAVLIFRPRQVRSRREMLYPGWQAHFSALVTRIRFSTFCLIKQGSNSILYPSFVVSYYQCSVNEEDDNGSVRGRAFVMTVCQRVRFPTVFKAPVPVGRVLSTVTMPIPIRFPPRLICASNGFFFFHQTFYVVLICNRRALRRRNYLCRITSIVLLSRELCVSHLSIPPVQVYAFGTINFLRGASCFLRALWTFFPTSMSPVGANRSDRGTRTTTS